jgi:hypothetical protein
MPVCYVGWLSRHTYIQSEVCLNISSAPRSDSVKPDYLCNG